ncbi:MAG TPA: MFS transporter [Streptosporangiaceae bacterium]|nr:MFS transporter [Streptosporangiaceae bacterium]
MSAVMEQQPASGSLRTNGDFIKLWTGQGISAVGTQVSTVALPLTAVISLHATAGQMGLLNTMQWLPFLLFALIIGSYADRLRRRPLLVIADIGRALVLGLIVTLAVTKVLEVPLLIGLVFLFGVFTVMFEVTYFAYLPTLVDRSLLVPANSRLQATASVAQVGGPALGGVLVQLVTAPIALLADAISFLCSVTSLLLLRTREERRPAPPAGEGNLHRIREGLKITYRNPFLRALVGVAASYNFFDEWILTLFLLYAVHDLHLHAGTIGLIISGGAVGAVVGSVLTGPASRWFGLGGALVISVSVESAVMLAIPFIPALRSYTVISLIVVYALNGFGVALSSVAAVSIRQSVTPDALLGRMTASYRSISYGAIPLGAAAGGLIGQLFGLRNGLLVGAAGMLTTIAWVTFSPLPKLRTVQDAEAAAMGKEVPAGAR